jgi:flavorubredoxin
MNKNKILKITDDVSWVGILDWDIVTFDIVMETGHGTTYNSYFIDAEKKAVIDTAKESFKDFYIEKLREVVNPKDIEYIIISHTEPDHSGSLKYILKVNPDATVYASRQAI